MQGTPHGTEQDLVICLGVVQANVIKLVGHSEYDMVMLHGQRGSHQVIYPNGLFGDLALRAMPVTTTVITIAHLSTLVTYLLVASHLCGTAFYNIVQGLYLPGR